MPASTSPREIRFYDRKSLPQAVRDLEIVEIDGFEPAGFGSLVSYAAWEWPDLPFRELKVADGRRFGPDQRAAYEALRDAAWALVETPQSDPRKPKPTRRQLQKQCRAAVQTYLRNGELPAEATRRAERAVRGAYDDMARHSEVTDISDRLYRLALKMHKDGDF